MAPLLLTRALIVHLASRNTREGGRDDRNELVHVWIKSIDIYDTIFIDVTASFRRSTIVTSGGLLAVASIVQSRQCLRTLSDNIGRSGRYHREDVFLSTREETSVPAAGVGAGADV